jgi:HD-GYP domain-containing protein (c-di-GMP phosphodiesterase class II)/putative methionine-R-sulfoxide reductase with GAF domain
VHTDGGGTGVAFDHGRPCTTIAYIHGHQSHQPEAGRVAELAPLAGGNGVAVMRSFTGGVASSIGSASDVTGTSDVAWAGETGWFAIPQSGDGGRPPPCIRFLHMSRSRVIAPLVSPPALDLAGWMTRLGAIQDAAELESEICVAFGQLLGLEAVAVGHRHGHGIEHAAGWARPGARPEVIGGARLLAAAELASNVGDVAQRTFGRRELIAIPLVGEGIRARVVAGTATPGWSMDDADRTCARALGVHAAVRLQLLAASADGSRATEAERSRGDRALDQMQLLLSLAGSFSAIHSVAEVGQIVVSQLRTLIDYHSCRFYVVSRDGRTLEPVALHGVGELYEDEHAEDLVCQVGEGITGTVFAEGRAQRIDDANDVPYALEIPGTDPIDESMLVAPMATDRGPVGVIVLSKQGLARFDDDDLRLLEVVAAQAATASERVRLHSSQAEAMEVSEALLELGAALALQASVDGIAAMLAAAVDRLVDCAAISVWTRDGDQLVPAAALGLTPREQRRMMGLRLSAGGVLGPALDTRRIATVPVEQAPALAGCLDAAPAGTTFSVVAVGERSANRGAVIVQRGPRRGPLSPRDVRMLLGIADQALLAIQNRALYDELQESFLATVEALGNALDLKDSYTNDHAQALVGLCGEVAERLGVAGRELRDIRFAAALHDIGKIGIPAEILNKPGPLTDDEFTVMKRHPDLGARILAPVPSLAGAAQLVVACHEHWDGGGYPAALSGEQIPLGARVILACDAFDAMTTDRCYRRAMTRSDAIAELRRCSGGQFDPHVVDALVAAVLAGAGDDLS